MAGWGGGPLCQTRPALACKDFVICCVLFLLCKQVFVFLCIFLIFPAAQCQLTLSMMGLQSTGSWVTF